jgi:predicted transcriptional regulator
MAFGFHQPMEQLKKIRILRKKNNLTQKQLANLAGVSQSLIAKIESNRIDPTYTKVQQILLTLEQINNKEEIKAKEIMQKKIIFADEKENIKDLILVMKKKGISQIPIRCKENICGLVTEKTIIDNLLKRENLSGLKAKEIMEDAPPIIGINTNLKTLLLLLKESPVVLVAQKGQIKGIISKTDLIERI